MAESGDYGDRHAAVYDRIYGTRFAAVPAVTMLAQAAGGGRVLELGVGTGRLAIPLAARGVRVDGIEASRAMLDQLCRRPGGRSVCVFEADLGGFDLPRKDYAVAACAVSTVFMLPDRAAQAGLFGSAARHLRTGGRLFIEAFRPDPTRFDQHGRRVERRPAADGADHVVRSQHDPTTQRITIVHELAGIEQAGSYEVSCTTPATPTWTRWLQGLDWRSPHAGTIGPVHRRRGRVQTRSASTFAELAPVQNTSVLSAWIVRSVSSSGVERRAPSTSCSSLRPSASRQVPQQPIGAWRPMAVSILSRW